MILSAVCCDQCNHWSVYECSLLSALSKTALLASVSASWRREEGAEQRDHRSQQPPDGGQTHHRETAGRQCKSLFIVSSPEDEAPLISFALFTVCRSEFLPRNQNNLLNLLLIRNVPPYKCSASSTWTYLSVPHLDNGEKNRNRPHYLRNLFCQAWLRLS